jgi:cysteine sulfinate desulfinase/cysteine desulfurase-like protein
VGSSPQFWICDFGFWIRDAGEDVTACLADSDEPSHVIKAMKPDTAASRQMIRFSIDATTTQAQLTSVVTAVECEMEALRE